MNFSIQSGRVDNFSSSRKTGWFTINFPQEFSNVPTVFAQIQSYNGPDSPGIRIQNVRTWGFEVRMDELVANGSSSSVRGDLGLFTSDSIHPNPEVLGWIAVG